MGSFQVRTIAMESTDGLVRGQSVISTGKPIMIPVGRGALGRIMNVIGEPVDDGGPIDSDAFAPIHREAPPFVEQNTEQQVKMTGVMLVKEQDESWASVRASDEALKTV